MTTTPYLDVRARLQEPFSPNDLSFRVGQAGTLLAYVDLRSYEDRMHQAAEGMWSVQNCHLIPVKDETAIALEVHVCGVPMVGVGDTDSPTSAYAQAFKRACAAHGLGRYLYNLPKLYQNQVQMEGQRLVTSPLSIAVWMYEKAGLPISDQDRAELDKVPQNLRFSGSQRTYQSSPTSQPASTSKQQQPTGTRKPSEKQTGVLKKAGLSSDQIDQLTNISEVISDIFAGMDLDDLIEKHLNQATPASTTTRKKAW